MTGETRQSGDSIPTTDIRDTFRTDARERSLVTFMTLVGVWATFIGVNEIFAAFSLREVGKRAEQMIE